MRALISLTVLSFALLGCEGPLLFVEVEEPELCVTEPDVQFPSAAGVPAQTLALDQDIVQDLGTDVPLIGLEENETRVRLNSVTLTARNGENVNVFGRIRLELLDAATPAQLPTIPLLTFDAASTAPASAITLQGADPVDLGPYIRPGSVRLHIVFEEVRLGELPDHDWTADVTTCVYLKHKADYGKFLGL